MRWPAEAIWEAVSPRLPGFTVEVLPEIGSTNTELMQRARAGRTEPLLLVAERQTAGRGRLGRQWHSQAATGGAADTQAGGGPDLPALTFSVGLPLAPRDWSGLSLAVGLALAQALDPVGERISLKWPNDLWVQGRKLAGILVETAAFPEPVARRDGGRVLPSGVARTTVEGGPAGRYTVVGVGINLSLPAATGLSTPPAALRQWWPQAQAGQVLGLVAPALIEALLAFEQEGFAPLQAAYAARDLLREQPLRLSDGTEGRGLGVDASGALRLATADGVQVVTSAEVSVRPMGAV
jgi:BirA family biotin operon repressor/biotin-[acetyl-CoA-carboxylase] ligase